MTQMLRLLFVLTVCGTLFPAVAQDAYGGALKTGSQSAQYLLDAVPRLLAVDAQGRAIPASETTNGLAVSWDVEFGDFASSDGEIRGGTLVTYTLRNDLVWGDGTPITAIDVFLTLVFIPGNELSVADDPAYTAAAPLSENRIAILYSDSGCGVLEQVNPRIQPAHVLASNFEDFLTSFASGDSVADQFRNWLEVERGNLQPPAFRDFDPVAWNIGSPRLRFVEFDEVGNMRFRLNNLAVTRVSSPSDVSEVDAFIAGELDVIINPPFSRRADLYGLPDVQIVEQVGRTWYAMGFNVADSRDPRDAFDQKTGEPLDQGINAFFGDLRVRQAVAMALDMDAIGQAATSGNYTRLAGDQLPYSWAYKPSMTFSEPTPLEASLLLDEAGWRDWDGNGIRECHGCSTAEENTPLAFSLSIGGDQIHDIIARMIREQLARIGVDVFSEFSGEASQAFDAYLLQVDEGYPIAADRGSMFRRSEDVRGRGANVTSVVDPQLDELFATAARAPQCDYAFRTEALMAASELIRENRYYLPLFAVNDLYAAQGAVEGFAPRQNDPYWNMSEWVINR